MRLNEPGLYQPALDDLLKVFLAPEDSGCYDSNMNYGVRS